MATKVVSSVFRSGLFKGKAAIITGGGSGIGKAVAQELLYLGCNVLIASRKVERLEEAASEMRSLLPRKDAPTVEVVECNIRKEEHVVRLIDTCLQKFGKLDYLINNGGGQFFSPAQDISLKGFNAIIETNLTGAFLCSREAYNKWMGEHGGVIVNMVANMFNGWPGTCPSGAARAGVDNLTKTLAIEWASSGVRVNAVAPGSSIFSSTAASNYGDARVFEDQIPRIPAKRLGTVEEVSGAIMFLLSPAASFISGETMRIDAGQSLYSTSSVYEIPEHTKSKPYTWEEDIKDQNKTSPAAKL